MSKTKNKEWKSHLWNHIETTAGKYFICKICAERMDKTGNYVVERHFLNRHGIKPGQMIRDYALVPTHPMKKCSPAMVEYISSHFDVNDDQNNWHCIHCSSTMIGRKKDPLLMENHLWEKHQEVYKQHSSNSVIDDYGRAGWSGASSNNNSNIMPGDNLPVTKTEKESDNDTAMNKVSCIYIPSDEEDEEVNQNLYNVEVNVSEGNDTISRYTAEEILQNEDTLDLAHKFQTKPETCLPAESEQILANIKREDTSNDGYSVDHAKEPRFSAVVGFQSNYQSVPNLSTWEHPHSSTNGEQNVKSANSERDVRIARFRDEDEDITFVRAFTTREPNAELSRSGRVDSTNLRNDSSTASSKRRLSNQPISPKKAKRQSLATDPVDERSLQNSSDSLPDSNNTPNDTSSDMQSLIRILSRYGNLNTEGQRRFKNGVSELLCELEEENTNTN